MSLGFLSLPLANVHLANATSSGIGLAADTIALCSGLETSNLLASNTLASS
jgi:hypothetical protein